MFHLFLELVMKDVWKASKTAQCSNLPLWKDSITNMLWYSFSTSSRNLLYKSNPFYNSNLGNEVSLREKILSIPLHLANQHSFPNNEQHKACCHDELTGPDRVKPWLVEGSKVSSRVFSLSLITFFMLQQPNW